MFSRLRSDIQCILDRDPAARSDLGGADLLPRLARPGPAPPAHWCWTHGLEVAGALYFTPVRAGRQASKFIRVPSLANGCFLTTRWGGGGETAEIGDGCTIYQGVTLGGTSLYKGAKRHPTLGKDVVVSAGAKVLGGFLVGDGAKIGSNAVVIKPVPAGATAVGIPARIIPSKNGQSADVTHK
jgi:serine O-acetyltransferase